MLGMIFIQETRWQVDLVAFDGLSEDKTQRVTTLLAN